MVLAGVNGGKMMARAGERSRWTGTRGWGKVTYAFVLDKSEDGLDGLCTDTTA